LRQRILEHRALGDHLVLLTGTLEFLAKTFAQDLQIDEVQATHCAHHLGRFTHFLPTQHPYSDEKLTIAKRLCERENVDIKNCVAYGNSINDRFLLNEVGHAVAVTPHYLLKRIAKQKGWEIIN
jgi:phosphoserine phosphatase